MNPKRGVYSRAEAFIDLIMECRYDACTVSNGGVKMELQPGQLVGAISWLASRWNWTPKTVRIWLDKLHDDGMIERVAPLRGKQAAIITLNNYSDYQFSPSAEGQANGKQGENKGQTKGNIYKDKQGNKGTIEEDIYGPNAARSDEVRDEVFDGVEQPSNKEPKQPKRKFAAPRYTERFEGFWRAYPDKTNNSKANAFAVWQQLPDEDQERAISALPGYARHLQAKPDLQCVHAERFLKYRRFDAYADAMSKDEGPFWRDPVKVSSITDDQWRGSIHKYANGIWRVDKLGPPPGHRECVVPKHIVDELSLTEKYTSGGILKIAPAKAA